MKGFTEMLALSELSLTRSLAHPLGGEWTAEELGWRQGDQLDLLLFVKVGNEVAYAAVVG